MRTHEGTVTRTLHATLFVQNEIVHARTLSSTTYALKHSKSKIYRLGSQGGTLDGRHLAFVTCSV